MTLDPVGSAWDGLTDEQISVKPSGPPRLSLYDHLSDFIGRKFVSFSAIFLLFAPACLEFLRGDKNGGLGEKENAFVVHGKLESERGQSRWAKFDWIKFGGLKSVWILIKSHCC